MTNIFIAESFLVKISNGHPQVIAFDSHLKRFQKSIKNVCEKFGISFTTNHCLNLQQATEKFLAELFNASKCLFPRLECIVNTKTSQLHFNFTLRNAPVLQNELTITKIIKNEGYLTNIKGPNIGYYSTLNNDAGGEVLLIDDKSNVLETTTTALLWWNDDTLFVSASNQRVQSVTEDLILQLAIKLGFKTSSAKVHAEDLYDKEVWSVNALHGLRFVRFETSPITPEADQKLLNLFQTKHASLAKTLKRLD